MKPIFVLVASLTLCLAVPEELMTIEGDYGKYDLQFGGRIVGGDIADIADLPYQVALYRNSKIMCGGSLIGAKTVLTAAHCVGPMGIINITELSIRAGSARNDTGGKIILPSSLLIHEDFNQTCWICTPKYDIALVFLVESAIGAGGVASIIPLADSVFAAGTIGTVSGWGAIGYYGFANPDLLRADVPVYDQIKCQDIYVDKVDSTFICAGYEEGGRGPCQGDSGGPYAINGQLAGIISWGRGCATKGYPAVYTNVAAFREWVRKNSGI